MVNQLDKEGKLTEDLVNPYWDEDEHVCPTTIRDSIFEAKKDIYYHLSFGDYKDVKVPYDEIQDLLDKIVKWFGDSK